MKELTNPFYGYGTAERATTANSSLYQQVDTAFGSPTYDEVGGKLRREAVEEREKGGGVGDVGWGKGGEVKWDKIQVDNPTYGLPTAPKSVLLMPEMSNPTYGTEAVPRPVLQTPKKIATNPIYGMQLTTSGVLRGTKDSQQLTVTSPGPIPGGSGPTTNVPGSTPARLESDRGQYSEVPAQADSFIYDAAQY